MPSLLSRYQHDAASAPRASLALPLVLFVASLLAYIGTSTKHSLLTSAVAWLSTCTYAALRTRGGMTSLLDAGPAQRLSWAAGALLALAQICERAVDGAGIWWAKALLPALIYTLVRGAVLESHFPEPSSPTPASPTKPSAVTVPYASRLTLFVFTTSALVAVYSHAGSVTAIALGLSYAVLEVLAYHLIARAHGASPPPGQRGGSVIYSANGLLAQPSGPSLSDEERCMSTLRHVSAAGALTTGLAALTLESVKFGGLAYYGLLGQAMGSHWVFGQSIVSVLYAIATVLMHIVMYGALILMVSCIFLSISRITIRVLSHSIDIEAGPNSRRYFPTSTLYVSSGLADVQKIQRQGAFFASVIPVSAAIGSELLLAFSLSRLWFALLCISSIFSLLDEQDLLSAGSRMRLRFGRILSTTACISFAVLVVYYLQSPLRPTAFEAPVDIPGEQIIAPPTEALKPLAYVDTKTHPVKRLISDAQASWTAKVRSQSQTLETAVAEYKRRYKIPPPPGFDKWYAFAKKREVQLIDDYDTIYHSLLPFWGLSPATIRQRSREALGFGDNMLMSILVRDGKAVHIEGGPDWLQQAAVGMMESFVEYLPDLDLPFNIHDEPRVVVPHDELSRLIQLALDKNMPAANAQRTPRNSFSKRPKDMSYRTRVPEVKTTHFNVFAHQPTWIPSRLSCPADSPARALEVQLAKDNMTAYALGELGFVYNQTAFSDVCNSPSYGESHGFFDRPNAFNVVHELYPVFSQSKMSSFNDILFPSPWYWFGKVDYKETSDMAWDKKNDKFWWRGSTTGGFSRNGGWRRQHRQKFVAKVNALDTATVLQNSNSAATDKDRGHTEWITKEMPRSDFKELIDVHFSHIGQCDPGDCDAQREFFGVEPGVDQQDAWKWKFLLDMDGNAFSGRFYAFLESRSLPLKMAVFREWHEDWIKPWLHYIPLSLKADEALEVVRYLDAEEEGKKMAIAVAEAGRDWARKALRNEDFEVWFFRLLLEYGRVVDDDRDKIGYSGA
ncbi:hypothetical protein AC579_2418 [Pseudocercospora musae]|uniref:Glycosyl transferase CAP10 domain-containing protein n=1 Tax=Pseudocercospora musae TaxID=113226 RepID=A0A139I9X8_9PEZI|nr:hypothetical protein AC579_2418 [Pseudocercospora musae]